MDTLIIRNGILVDAESGISRRGDLAVEGNRIRAVGTVISGNAVSEIDASGCYVTPGLIDHHTHIYPLASMGISGEGGCFGAGVTTAVDAALFSYDDAELLPHAIPPVSPSTHNCPFFAPGILSTSVLTAIYSPSSYAPVICPHPAARQV